jgi:hypothetical protein
MYALLGHSLCFQTMQTSIVHFMGMCMVLNLHSAINVSDGHHYI